MYESYFVFFDSSVPILGSNSQRVFGFSEMYIKWKYLYQIWFNCDLRTLEIYNFICTICSLNYFPFYLSSIIVLQVCIGCKHIQCVYPIYMYYDKEIYFAHILVSSHFHHVVWRTHERRLVSIMFLNSMALSVINKTIKKYSWRPRPLSLTSSLVTFDAFIYFDNLFSAN